MDSATELEIVMRASRILAVLTLLIAPPSAFGQQAEQDVSPPLDAACAFSADERWRPPMVETTVATFGRLDAAYNNAGVQNVVAEAAEATREDFDRVMSINLRGVWSCMKFELRQMLKQGSGAIVNCSSIGGLVGGPRRGTYQASKHGVLGLTKSAALEYAARGIRINAVCPGIIHTSTLDRMMTTQADALNAMLKDVPIARLGRPEEIASAVLWLCSSAASFVVGHALAVDGGYTVR
jgi:NAD(P)-dependent dehydrogenase (short-subunit alcohol dehydrogenase family)